MGALVPMWMSAPPVMHAVTMQCARTMWVASIALAMQAFYGTAVLAQTLTSAEEPITATNMPHARILLARTIAVVSPDTKEMGLSAH